MWIVVPLILLMSWRTCRSLGQAISETAAWAAGYLGTAGVIVIANWGNIDIIRDRPDSPGSALAILGGFVGMGISRYLWKRRGGHLNRKPNRWVQAMSRSVQAMRATPSANGKAAAPARKTAPAKRPAATSTTPAAKAKSTTTAKRSTAPRTGGTIESTARELGRNPNVRKAVNNRWVRGSVRAIGAMLEQPDPKKRPQR